MCNNDTRWWTNFTPLVTCFKCRKNHPDRGVHKDQFWDDLDDAAWMDAEEESASEIAMSPEYAEEDIPF